MNTKTRLKQLGIVLPKPKEPVGLYVSTLVVGNRLLISGHGPWLDGKPVTGKLGADMSTFDGHKAAYQVGLGMLASIESEIGLDKVVRLVRTFGMVNCIAEFTNQPAVIDGFSELMAAVFGAEMGVGTRSAVGFMSLPFGIAVEIEAEFEIKLNLRARLGFIRKGIFG